MSKIFKKINNWSYLECYFTFILQWPNLRWPWPNNPRPRFNFPKICKKLNDLLCIGYLTHIFHTRYKGITQSGTFNDPEADDLQDYRSMSNFPKNGRKKKQKKNNKKTRSIQRTQTPPRLWPLTLSCDLELKSRSKRLMSLDAAYCIVPWYQVWCLWV